MAFRAVGKWDPSHDVPYRIARFQDQLASQHVPQTFVAVDGPTVLGSASLVESDLDSHNHLTPWMASVYVDAAARRRGVGSALVRRIIEAGRELGLPALYLFTPDQEPLYASLGWQTIEHAKWGDTPVVIMKYDLTAENR